jgi:hypothetical protein
MRRASKLPDHFAQVKAALTDVRAVLAGLGLLGKAKRKGDAFDILCPWHDEHTPSCRVSVRAHGALQAHCFGCGETGDVLNLIAAVHRLDLRRDAQAILSIGADLAGIALDFGHAGVVGAGPIYQAPTARPAPVRLSTVDEAASIEAFDAAVEGLIDLCDLRSDFSGTVRNGLWSRGLSGEAWRDGWGELPINTPDAKPQTVVTPSQPAGAGLEEFGRDGEDMAAGRLVALLKERGLAARLPWLVRGSGFLFSMHRLLIPWRTPAGKVWMLQRRFAPVSGDERPGPHDGGKYREQTACKGGRAWPYGIERFHEGAAQVWLVEGAADVLAVRRLNRYGLLNRDRRPLPLVALGLPGVTGWERCKASILPLLAGRTLVIATDADAAGDGLVDSVLTDAAGVAAKCKRRTAPPPFKDWSDVLREEWRKGNV